MTAPGLLDAAAFLFLIALLSTFTWSPARLAGWRSRWSASLRERARSARRRSALRRLAAEVRAARLAGRLADAPARQLTKHLDALDSDLVAARRTPARQR